MPFCSNCGTNIGNSERFCGQCGAPRSPQMSEQQIIHQNDFRPQQVNAIANQSRVVATFPQARMMTPMGPSDIYTIALTPTQAIMAKLTSDILNDVAKKSQAQSKAEEKGWLGRVNDQRRAVGSAHLRYLEMTSEQILAETAGNFAIDHASVASIRVRAGYEQTNQDVPGDPYTEIELYSNRGTFKYRLRMQAKEVVELLNNFYPGRIMR